MNRRESAILSAYTGFLCGPFDAMHAYAEEKLQRPVWTHEFGSGAVVEELKRAAESDFIELAKAAQALPQEPWESAKKFTDDDAAAAQKQMIDSMPADLRDKTVFVSTDDLS